MTEDQIYLQNYWVPRVGNNTTLGKIESFCADNKDQVVIGGKLEWVQDLIWSPEQSEYHLLFADLGANVNNGNVHFHKCSWPLPNSQENCVKLLRIIRNYAYLTSIPDPIYKVQPHLAP